MDQICDMMEKLTLENSPPNVNQIKCPCFLFTELKTQFKKLTSCLVGGGDEGRRRCNCEKKLIKV